MPASLIRTVTFDAADPWAAAAFWAGVLDRQVDPDAKPDDPDVELPGEPNLLFQQVPEGKTVKNRVHFDLQPATGTRDQEVERVRALGATEVGDFRRPDGTGWVTFQDPEGNEFCVERSAAERTAS